MPWMRWAPKVFNWSEWLRQRPGAGALSHHLWPGLMSRLWQWLPCRTAWGNSVTVALVPVYSPALYVVRHTTALELGTVAWSLAGLPVSALIPSASCGSSVCKETKVHVCLCVLVSLCLEQADNLSLWQSFQQIKACTCALFLVFLVNPIGVNLFWDLLRVQPIIVLSIVFNQAIILQIAKSGESMMMVQTTILLFKSTFFKCLTGRSFHFIKDMLSISQLICKRLGREITPLLTSAAWYWLLTFANISSHAVLSISYFPKKGTYNPFLYFLCCWLPVIALILFKH